MSFDVGRRNSPVLTTRNALIGQSFTDLAQLEQVFTPQQIYQLALDRTAVTSNYSIPPGPAATPIVYGTDLATLRFLTETRRLTVLADGSGTQLRYELWKDHRAALRAFVHHMNGTD